MARILLVDDDFNLVDTVQPYLKSHGHVVDSCYTGEDALQLLSSYSYDVIALDWTLPGIHGDAVCKEYRASGGQAPIIFLTGKEDVQSLELALGYGADDYLVKPFDIRVLNARIKALLRRAGNSIVPVLKIQDLVLDPEGSSITVNDQTVRLRAKEKALLEYLMRHPNRVFSSQQLLDAVWPADSDSSTTSVRTWMGLLRHKLAEVGREELIRTVLGSGYIIDDPASKASASAASPTSEAGEAEA